MVVGVEPDPAEAELARQVLDQVASGTFPAVAPDVQRDGGYDVIVFNDVLEHMPDPVQALDAARDLLAPDGVVVSSIPNVRHVSASAPLVLRGQWTYVDLGVLDSTHLRFFTASSIRELFVGSGWEITRFEPINFCLEITDPEPRWWIHALGAVSFGRSDPFFTLQYTVVARPLVRGPGAATSTPGRAPTAAATG